MWLSSRNHNFHIGYLTLNFKKLCEYHSSNLAAANQSHLEHRISVFPFVEVDTNLVSSITFRHVYLKLSSFFSIRASSKGPKDFPIYARKVNTLKHYNVTNDFTCHESILEFFIWYKVL